jgi:hypothetical protein
MAAAAAVRKAVGSRLFAAAPAVAAAAGRGGAVDDLAVAVAVWVAVETAAKADSTAV